MPAVRRRGAAHGTLLSLAVELLGSALAGVDRRHPNDVPGPAEPDSHVRGAVCFVDETKGIGADSFMRSVVFDHSSRTMNMVRSRSRASICGHTRLFECVDLERCGTPARETR